MSVIALAANVHLLDIRTMKTVMSNMSNATMPSNTVFLPTTDQGGTIVFVLHGFRFTIMVMALLLICTTGTIVNGLVCLVIIKAKLHLSSFHGSLFVLHASTCGVGFVGSVISACTLSMPQYDLNGWVCVLYGFLLAWLGIGCVTTLALISFQWYRKLSTFNQTASPNYHVGVKLVAIWTYSFAVTCPPLFGWNRYVPEALFLPCSVDWASQSVSDRLFVAYIYCFGLFIPLGIIMFSYVRILQITHELKEQHPENNLLLRQRVLISWMIALMIFAFILAWFPYALQSLIMAFGRRDLISVEVAVTSMIMAKSSICYNPIIYAYVNQEVRMASTAFFEEIKNKFRHHKKFPVHGGRRRRAHVVYGLQRT